MNNPLKPFFFGLALLGCSLVMPVASHAQEQETAYTTAIESTGLYGTENHKALGNGLYHGADRASMVALIKNIETGTAWASQNKLVKLLLLTQADTSILENNIPFNKESDLLTLRLQALIALGLYNEAFSLYTKLDDVQGHSQLHYFGVLSMLLSGEKALACVEVNTLFSTYSENADWQTLKAYCTISLSGSSAEISPELLANSYALRNLKENPDFVFPYEAEVFESLSTTDKAFIIAEGRFDISHIPLDSYKNIKASHVQALMKMKSLSADQNLLLHFRGVETGMIEPASLSALFTTTAKAMEKEKRDLSKIESIISLYTEMEKSWLKSSKTNSLTNILEYADIYGTGSLVPFMPALQKISPDDMEITFERMKPLLQAAIISNSLLPFDWAVSLAEMNVENTEQKNLRDRLLIASFLLSDLSKASNKNLRVVVDIIEKSYIQAPMVMKNILENIDIQLGNHANVSQTYENYLILGSNKSYKMPSYALLNTILNASGKSVASVILLSNVVLTKQAPEEMYLGTLGFICEAMNKIGLTQEARNMLAEYVLRAENDN